MHGCLFVCLFGCLAVLQATVPGIGVLVPTITSFFLDRVLHVVLDSFRAVAFVQRLLREDWREGVVVSREHRDILEKKSKGL